MIAKVDARQSRCSFCGRSRGEVDKIVAGAPHASRGVPRRMVGKSVYICNECVLRCKNMIAASDIPGQSTATTS
jgi:ATP-dependent protease Clp ATPase subunit